MQARSIMFETGKISLPKQAPWLDTYLKELLRFRNTSYADQVDSTAQALDYIQRRFTDNLVTEPRERPRVDKRPRGRSTHQPKIEDHGTSDCRRSRNRARRPSHRWCQRPAP
jgi:hypothetical protein